MPELQFTPLRQPPRSEGATPLLRIRSLTVRIGIRRIIEGLTLDLFEGDMLCISGPNGSGKSTLLNAIAGLEPASIEAGAILLAGEDVTSLPAHERARRGIAYVRQRGNVFTDLTVADNLRLALGPEGPTRFGDAYPAWVTELPSRKRVGLLSGGQKQRLAWGMGALRPSRLLLADEPESGLSEDLRYPENKTVLLVSHHAGRSGEAVA